MTWTKLSDSFYDDPAMLAVDRDARLLYVEALTWCNRYGTDGAISDRLLPRITDSPDPGQAAKSLVEAGLWERTETGWAVRGFLTAQPSAEDVERTANLARQRQRRQRQHRLGDHSLCNPAYCRQASVTRETTRESRRESRHPGPTRPVPTRPEGTVEGSGGGGSEQADRSRSRAAQAPPRPSPTARRAKKGVASPDDELIVRPGSGLVDSAEPSDLVITTDAERDEHVEIGIRPAAVDREFGDLTSEQFQSALASAMRVLARLVRGIKDEMADQQRLHKCPRYEGNWSVCEITTSNLDADVTENGYYADPYVSLTVPAERSQLWLECIVYDLEWNIAP